MLPGVDIADISYLIGRKGAVKDAHFIKETFEVVRYSVVPVVVRVIAAERTDVPVVVHIDEVSTHVGTSGDKAIFQFLPIDVSNEFVTGAHKSHAAPETLHLTGYRLLGIAVSVDNGGAHKIMELFPAIRLAVQDHGKARTVKRPAQSISGMAVKNITPHLSTFTGIFQRIVFQEHPGRDGKVTYLRKVAIRQNLEEGSLTVKDSGLTYDTRLVLQITKGDGVVAVTAQVFAVALEGVMGNQARRLGR